MDAALTDCVKDYQWYVHRFYQSGHSTWELAQLQDSSTVENCVSEGKFRYWPKHSTLGWRMLFITRHPVTTPEELRRTYNNRRRVATATRFLSVRTHHKFMLLYNVSLKEGYSVKKKTWSDEWQWTNVIKEKKERKRWSKKLNIYKGRTKKNTKTDPSARSNRRVSNIWNVIFNKNKIYIQVCSSKEFCK